VKMIGFSVADAPLLMKRRIAENGARIASE
jgi:hypothetical protein